MLIVEDDLDTRAALTNMLKLLGHDVAGVSTAGDALLKLRARHFDAVLLDLVLPDESGAVVLHEIRERKWPVKVAVVTALPTDHKKLADLMADAVFAKPVDAFELAGWIGMCAEPRKG